MTKYSTPHLHSKVAEKGPTLNAVRRLQNKLKQITDGTYTKSALSPVHAVVPNATAKPMATLSLLCAVVLDATARTMAAPSEDEGKLDQNNGSGDVVTI